MNVDLCLRMAVAMSQLPCKIIETRLVEDDDAVGGKYFEVGVSVGLLKGDSDSMVWSDGGERTVKGTDIGILHRGPMQVQPQRHTFQPGNSSHVVDDNVTSSHHPFTPISPFQLISIHPSMTFSLIHTYVHTNPLNLHILVLTGPSKRCHPLTTRGSHTPRRVPKNIRLMCGACLLSK